MESKKKGRRGEGRENNNDNEYLQRLTRTGPKRLHVLYKYILSKFNAYNMNAHTHRLAHTHSCARTHAHIHTHTPFTYQGNETEEKVLKKRKAMKKMKKTLTKERKIRWGWSTNLTLPCRSPEARCSPSGLTRIERTPFFPSQVVSVLSVAPAAKQTASRPQQVWFNSNLLMKHDIYFEGLTTTAKTYAEDTWVK